MKNHDQTLGLSDLIHQVKRDLLSDKTIEQDPYPLFAIDEITIEINFTLSGDIHSGFDFVVVQLGSKVAEERVHKAIVRLTPLLTKEQLTSELVKTHPDIVERVVSDSTQGLLKGGSTVGDAPRRT